MTPVDTTALTHNAGSWLGEGEHLLGEGFQSLLNVFNAFSHHQAPNQIDGAVFAALLAALIMRAARKPDPAKVAAKKAAAARKKRARSKK